MAEKSIETGTDYVIAGFRELGILPQKQYTDLGFLPAYYNGLVMATCSIRDFAEGKEGQLAVFRYGESATLSVKILEKGNAKLTIRGSEDEIKEIIDSIHAQAIKVL